MSIIEPLNQINRNTYDTYNTNTNSTKSDINYKQESSSNSTELEKDEYIKSENSTDSTKELYHLSTLNTSAHSALQVTTQEEHTANNIFSQESNNSTRADIEIANYDPNDLSFGVTFADKNSKILPTINNDLASDKITSTSETSTKIHTDSDGTRFLVIQTIVGEQTFEKSIKLSENL